MRSLLTGSALAVDGDAGNFLRETGGQQGVTADVYALFACLRDAPHDYIVDQSRIEIVALDQGLQRMSSQVRGVPVLQLAVAPTCRSTDGIHDDAFRMRGSLWCGQSMVDAFATEPRAASYERRAASYEP